MKIIYNDCVAYYATHIPSCGDSKLFGYLVVRGLLGKTGRDRWNNTALVDRDSCDRGIRWKNPSIFEVYSGSRVCFCLTP